MDADFETQTTPGKTPYPQLAADYQVVERALQYLEAHHQHQPTLAEVAASVGFSEYHFQRLFTRWVGISPKRFLQFLTKEHACRLLEGASSVLQASCQSGLSSPGRLHDLFVTCEAVTPGEYKLRGEGLTIHYGFHPTPFGEGMLATTERGICALSFVAPGERQDRLAELAERWARARLVQDDSLTAALVERIFPLAAAGMRKPLPLFLSGTNFQIKVWEALLRIPPGGLTTYGEIARQIGAPRAARAVGSALGSNPVAVLIPCHRVIRQMGVFGNYRWGSARKKALLGWEMAHALA